MIQKIVLSIMLCLVPQVLLSAPVTQDVLARLDVAVEQRSVLLSQDTEQWQSGAIGSDVVRYTVAGDVIGYDAVKRVWWRLVTPVTTELPITALALSMDSDGVVIRQIVTLVAAKEMPQRVQEKKVSATTVKSVADAAPVAEKVQHVPVVKENVVQQTSPKNSLIEVSSVWDFMAEYQRQISGGM
jgi:hypothetical protein